MPLPDRNQSIDATFPQDEGHTIATGNVTVIVTTQTYSLTFTIEKLKFVQRILDLQIDSNPLTNTGDRSLHFIVDNVVGITMMDVAAGVTVIGSTFTCLLTCIGV